MDNERLTQNELAVTSIQNVAKLISQRLDNFENASANQQTQLTDLTRTQQTDVLQALADANKKTNDQLLQGMTALLQQNQRLLGNDGLIHGGDTYQRQREQDGTAKRTQVIN